MSATSQQGFRRKIKTREELREAIGPLPREKKVIMCHGTFDLVHPGHIRHLMYAKDHADVLVVSLTSDAHINKANFRPFVPQDLRAMNLAALECVDYVIIDEDATPIENLKVIQPDFFAKGYEYSAEGVHPKTRRKSRRSNRTGVNSFSRRAIWCSRRPPSLRARRRTWRWKSSSLCFTRRAWNSTISKRR